MLANLSNIITSGFALSTEEVTTSLTAFALIATAEIGDKSQLVCMTLAAKHRGLPILSGALVAFGLLNLLAVLFGATLAHWIPPHYLASAVALLFLGFGMRSLLMHKEDEETEPLRKSGHGLFFTTLLLLFMAEFGDKTQLAVAGLSASAPIVPVWLGATVALTLTSALGIWAGRTVLQRMPLRWLHRFSGLIFIGLALVAGWQALPEELTRAPAIFSLKLKSDPSGFSREKRHWRFLPSAARVRPASAPFASVPA